MSAPTRDDDYTPAAVDRTIDPEIPGSHEVLVERLQLITAERDTAMHDRDTAQHRLEAFKKRVRETALKVSQEEGWCRPGMNGVLKNDLDLPPYTQDYRASIRVVVYQDIPWTVEAEDEDQAQERLEGLSWEDVKEHVDNDNWEFSDDGIEIQYGPDEV